jgi:hypothetical protein
MHGTRARVLLCVAGAPVRVAGVMPCGNCAPVRGFARELWRVMPRVTRGHAVGMARVCRGRGVGMPCAAHCGGFCGAWLGIARGRVARGMAGHFRGAARHFGRVAWRGESFGAGALKTRKPLIYNGFFRFSWRGAV